MLAVLSVPQDKAIASFVLPFGSAFFIFADAIAIDYRALLIEPLFLSH